MWCPRCGSEFRETFFRCASCDTDLVAQRPQPQYAREAGPLTGRPIEEELLATGPTIAGTFVTQEEAQAARAALSEAGITAEIVNRDEQLPMTVQGEEPSLAVAVNPPDLSQARSILRSRGLIPTAVARFRREEDARSAMSLLESKGLRPRLSTLVLEEIPADIRGDLDPYILEVPAAQEVAANRSLVGAVVGSCEACGGEIRFEEISCAKCGHEVGI
jgi:hypothetical protein